MHSEWNCGSSPPILGTGKREVFLKPLFEASAWGADSDNGTVTLVIQLLAILLLELGGTQLFSGGPFRIVIWRQNSLSR
jgi:hypothetical protein